MKVIIAGGGTGGHIFPAISIAEELLGRSAENKVLFVGTTKGMEGQILPKRGYKVEFISSGAVAGRNIKKTLNGIASALKGLLESQGIIRRFEPDLVLGVGGYASGPMVLAAAILRVPTAICEQNSIPGITNRILGKAVERVFASFEESSEFFPHKKTKVVGNPIRNGIIIHKEIGSLLHGIRVLVFGGSQGANKLNISVPKAFGILGRSDISVVHQTGERDFQDVKKMYEWYGIRAEVLTFIDDMANAYKSADLVIGRSGAGTIAEVTAVGLPSILIPYPFSANNHQLENAHALEKKGAAVVIEDKDASPERLAAVLSDILSSEKLKEMGSRAKGFGKPNAAREIVDELEKLAHVR